MAADSLEICNSALHKLGASSISALNDGSKAANILNHQYDRLRKELLRAHPWNFSIAYAQLSSTGNTPIWNQDWTYEFLIPDDVLRILETDLQDDTTWELGYNVDGNRVVFTSENAMKIKYIKDITNTTRFSSDFDEVLSLRIAADIAYSLTQSRALQRDMFNYYNEALRQARSFDSQENSLQYIEADTFTDIRG